MRVSWSVACGVLAVCLAAVCIEGLAPVAQAAPETRKKGTPTPTSEPTLTPAPTPTAHSPEESLSPGGAQIALNELIELSRQIAALEAAGKSDPRTISELKDRMAEIEMRLREWVAESRYRDAAAEDLKHFASATLELATTWIHTVAILFTVVALAIGVGNFLESRQLKKEIERERNQLSQELATAKAGLEADAKVLNKQVEEALSGINAIHRRSTDDMATFKKEIDDERLSSGRTRAFVQAVAENFFKDALLELLEALHRAGALRDADHKELRDKTKEIEARLFLRYPDTTRAEAAVRNLMALESEDALVDLSQFAADPDVSSELKTLAHQAMIRISEKRGAARAAGPASAGKPAAP